MCYLEEFAKRQRGKTIDYLGSIYFLENFDYVNILR